MLITHDMGVIAETCDRVAVMYAGRIVETGPVRAILHHPSHPYTAGLMGAIPAMDRDCERLVQIEGAMPRAGARPTGCAFHPRCSQARPECCVDRPELMPQADSQVACWWPLPSAEGSKP
jgi:peptide/nickel transport system ATP-binding protein